MTDDMDRDLQDLGRKWRDSQRHPPTIDPSMLVAAAPRTLPTLSWLVGIAAVVTVLGVGFSLIGQQNQPRRATAGIGAQAAIPARGEEVTATGVVVMDGNGVARICDPLPVRSVSLSQEQPAECSGVAVVVRGVDVPVLPGWIQLGAIGSSDMVRVAGIWTGDAIDTTAVVAAPLDSALQPNPPCQTPDAGWPDPPSDEAEFETALSRLGDQLAANPASFSGYWVSSGGSDRVVVVGVVGEPTAARSELDAVFPYPLCVAQVDYSSIDLARAATGISKDLESRPRDAWRARVSQPLNRVSLRIPVVDASIMRLLEKYPEAAADPLVRTASMS